MAGGDGANGACEKARDAGREGRKEGETEGEANIAGKEATGGDADWVADAAETGGADETVVGTVCGVEATEPGGARATVSSALGPKAAGDTRARARRGDAADRVRGGR